MTEHFPRSTFSAAERNRRNLNPHKAARLAMFKWSAFYAWHVGGSMDFWDELSESAKSLCREVVKEIEKSPEESR